MTPEGGSEPNNPDTAVATGKPAEGAGKETVEEKADPNDKNKGDIQDKPNPENEKSCPKIDVDELGAGLRSQLSSPFMSNFAHNSKDDNFSAKLQEMAKQMESEHNNNLDYDINASINKEMNAGWSRFDSSNKLARAANYAIDFVENKKNNLEEKGVLYDNKGVLFDIGDSSVFEIHYIPSVNQFLHPQMNDDTQSPFSDDNGINLMWKIKF